MFLKSGTPLEEILQLREIDKLAKRLYNEYTDNHPIIHSNRFPSWEELTENTRDEWVERAHRSLDKK
jgi:hypothetical protein